MSYKQFPASVPFTGNIEAVEHLACIECNVLLREERGGLLVSYKNGKPKYWVSGDCASWVALFEKELRDDMQLVEKRAKS